MAISAEQEWKLPPLQKEVASGSVLIAWN